MSRVFVPIPISGIEEEKEQPSLTYKLDLDTGRIVGKVDGLEAVNQFILKALTHSAFPLPRLRQPVRQRNQGHCHGRERDRGAYQGGNPETCGGCTPLRRPDS